MTSEVLLGEYIELPGWDMSRYHHVFCYDWNEYEKEHRTRSRPEQRRDYR